jgi:hypothetical protein
MHRPRTPRPIRPARLRLQALEDRATPAAGLADVFQPMVIAGSPKVAPGDSTDQRVDPNTTSSPFAGVGSIQVQTKATSFIGTGTVIGKRSVLTAAHVVDLNNDGKVDRRDGAQGVYFILNVGGDQTAKIAVTGFNIAPDFSGFGHPAVNDDLAVLTLAEDVPDGVPIYQLATSELEAGTVLTMVGYGRAGDGLRGYTTTASPSVKRVGENTADAFYGQDDKGRPEANEVFRFDFDGPTGKGPMGGPTLGNDKETQLGGGDSGGPAFSVGDGGQLTLVGVTSFTQGANAPRFGSMGGGANLYAYQSFLWSALGLSDGPSSDSSSYTTPTPPGGVRGGPGVHVGANPLRNPIKIFPPPPPQPEPPVPTTPPVQNPPIQEPPPVVVPVPNPVPLPPPVVVVPPPEEPPPSLPSAIGPDPIIDATPDDPVMTLPDRSGSFDLVLVPTMPADSLTP